MQIYKSENIFSCFWKSEISVYRKYEVFLTVLDKLYPFVK